MKQLRAIWVDGGNINFGEFVARFNDRTREAKADKSIAAVAIYPDLGFELFINGIDFMSPAETLHQVE